MCRRRAALVVSGASVEAVNGVYDLESTRKDSRPKWARRSRGDDACSGERTLDSPIPSCDVQLVWSLGLSGQFLDCDPSEDKHDCLGGPELSALYAGTAVIGAGGFYVDMFIRRYTRDTRPWIAFHCDESSCTANIALCDDSEHEGGRRRSRRATRSPRCRPSA